MLRDQVGHLMEIEKTRQGGTLQVRSKAKSKSSAKPMPQGKGRNAKPAKPKRKAVPAGGRDISAKTAKRMIADRQRQTSGKPSGKPSGKSSSRSSSKPRSARPNKSNRRNTPNKGRR